MNIAVLYDDLVKANRIRENAILSDSIGDYQKHKLKIEYECVKEIIAQLDFISQKN